MTATLKRRCRRPTPEEKALAAHLREQGYTYAQIGNDLGRPHSTILRWLNPDQNERQRKRSSQWSLDNREQHRLNSRKYRTCDHGIASKRSESACRRLQKTNTPEFILIDDQWYEVDRKETWRVFGEYLLPPKERKAIQELYLEAQYLTETTGIEYQVDHILPLSKGGEHLMYNLQILTAEENLSKRDKFRLEDQNELIRRLFG